MTPLLPSNVLELQQNGILVPITRVPTEAIIVGCGDADAAIHQRHRNKIQDNHQKRIRHHLVAQNGGYLQSWDWVTNQILGATTLKGLTEVVICGHTPCAMAQVLGISLREQIEEQKRLIQYLLNHPPFKAGQIKIFSHFHIDTGEDHETGLFELN